MGHLMGKVFKRLPRQLAKGWNKIHQLNSLDTRVMRLYAI